MIHVDIKNDTYDVSVIRCQGGGICLSFSKREFQEFACVIKAALTVVGGRGLLEWGEKRAFGGMCKMLGLWLDFAFKKKSILM